MKPLSRRSTCKASGATLLRRSLAFLFTASAMFSVSAGAVPCAGFTDVDSASPFCPSVEWVKNRNVTAGCAATAYCPEAPVSRLAMAAFMNRLGTALTPVQLRVDIAPGPVDLDANAVVCQTNDFAVTGFPRRAFVDLTFNGAATGTVVLAADLVMSTNAGASWTALNAIANRGSIVASQWGALSDIASVDLDVGQTIRFGARVSRGGVAGGTDLSDSRCQMRVLVYSRDGVASPF